MAPQPVEQSSLQPQSPADVLSLSPQTQAEKPVPLIRIIGTYKEHTVVT